MTKRAIITIATRNYAHYAYALGESVSRHNPECDFFICFVDNPVGAEGLDCEAVSTILASNIGIENWRRFAFQYTPFELSCALKPFAIGAILEKGYDEVVYLDGDMRVLSPLEAVFNALKTDSIVLTPHLICPFPEDNCRPSEDLFLMAGTFNAGFLAVRNDNVSTAFIDWWKRRLSRHCYVDLSASMFVDQKWLSLVPGLFDRVNVLRDPAYNAGHWTLPQFSLSLDSAGRACIGNHPIALFHFSNLNPTAPLEFDHCQNRTTLNDQPILKSMVAEYHESLKRFNVSDFSSQGCEFDTLSDGTPIRPEWREAIRRDHPGFGSVTDPFDVHSSANLVDRFVSIEAGARKWRKDWRLKGVKSSAEITRTKGFERKIKSVLSALGLRKKAA
ncbi:hypothetical protein SH449x_005135 [Pirellulaceae bacterium SH449]